MKFSQSAIKASTTMGHFGGQMNYANEAANKAKEQYSKQRKFIEERDNSFTTVFDFVCDVKMAFGHQTKLFP